MDFRKPIQFLQNIYRDIFSQIAAIIASKTTAILMMMLIFRSLPHCLSSFSIMHPFFHAP